MKELMKKCLWLKVKFPFKRSHKQNQTLSLYPDLKKKIRIRKRYMILVNAKKKKIIG